MTEIDSEAVKQARLLVKADFDQITDLPIELQNTIVNIYYKLAQSALSRQRGEKEPGLVALADFTGKSYRRYVEDSVFLIESRKSLPGIICSLRTDVLAKQDQESIDFMISFLLGVFKYRIPNIMEMSMLRTKFEKWRRNSSVDEIEHLYQLFQ